jgi:hypothetical protein
MMVAAIAMGNVRPAGRISRFFFFTLKVPMWLSLEAKTGESVGFNQFAKR